MGGISPKTFPFEQGVVVWLCLRFQGYLPDHI